MRISRDSDSDPCPVTDDLLGELYRANKNGLPELIATVSPDVRAALAMYCYRRGHLKSIGLAIASTCDIYDLETVGGTAGAALFARSREVAPAAPVASQYVARQKITLASGSLRKTLPIDEDVEPDDAPESDPPVSASLESEPPVSASSEPEPPKSVPPESASSEPEPPKSVPPKSEPPESAPPQSAPSESAWNFLFARRTRPPT
jgi:hypothetical protein